jgi:hypothetical protein
MFVFFAIGMEALSACSGGTSGSSLLPSHGQSAIVNGHPNAVPMAQGLTVSGPITKIFAGGFTIHETSGCPSVGYLHVMLSPGAAINGPAPAVGETLQASGSGSCSTQVSATTITISAVIPISSTSVPTNSPSPIPAQPGQSTHASTVFSTWTGGFTISPQGSSGYMHVYTNASTVMNGGTPKNGMYAVATGTGGPANFTATFVQFFASAPSVVTLSGTANAATASGFTLNAGSQSAPVPVVLNSATIQGGGTLSPGSQVKVTGLGSAATSVLAQSIVISAPSPSPGASPTATPAPISSTHVLTEDYLGAPYGTTSITWSSAAPYLSWAQTASNYANAVSGAGIKTQLYVDPNRTVAGVGDPLYTSDETTFAHDCSSNRVMDTYSGSTTQYVMDIGSASMQSLFANYIASKTAVAHYDSIYEDDAGPLSPFETYTPFSSMPCQYSDTAWINAGMAINQAQNVPVIFNGLSALNGHNMAPSVNLLAASNTIGANYEHCYSDSSTAKMGGWLWQVIEQTEMYVGSLHRNFVCQLRNTAPAQSATDARLYALASFLLTYDPSTSVLWEEFATNSGFHVMPEAGLILLDPVGGAASNISSLQASGGTYGRQYGQCFLHGAFVGSCAVVVNPDAGASHPFPYPQYTHSLVLQGSGVLDGGSVITNGPPPPASLAPMEAAVVFP